MRWFARPLLELHRAVEKESFEKFAAVRGGRVLQGVAVGRRLETHHIGHQPIAVELQPIDALEQRLAAELRT